MESVYARAALRSFYWHLRDGKVPATSLEDFIAATGLRLLDDDGTMREDLPPISTFLNRVLALPIAMQKAPFAHFEGLLTAQVEGAIAAGTHDVGFETIRAESLTNAMRLPPMPPPAPSPRQGSQQTARRHASPASRPQPRCDAARQHQVQARRPERQGPRNTIHARPPANPNPPEVLGEPERSSLPS